MLYAWPRPRRDELVHCPPIESDNRHQRDKRIPRIYSPYQPPPSRIHQIPSQSRSSTGAARQGTSCARYPKNRLTSHAFMRFSSRLRSTLCAYLEFFASNSFSAGFLSSPEKLPVNVVVCSSPHRLQKRFTTLTLPRKMAVVSCRSFGEARVMPDRLGK